MTPFGGVKEQNIRRPPKSIYTTEGGSRLKERMNDDGALIIDGSSGEFCAFGFHLKCSGRPSSIGGGLGTASAQEVARKASAFVIMVSKDGAVKLFCGEAEPIMWKEDAATAGDRGFTPDHLLERLIAQLRRTAASSTEEKSERQEVTEEKRQKLQEDLSKAESRLRVFKLQAKKAEVELDKYHEWKKQFALRGDKLPNKIQADVLHPLLVQNIKEEVEKAEKEIADILSQVSAQGITLTRDEPATGEQRLEEAKAQREVKEAEKELAAEKKETQKQKEMVETISEMPVRFQDRLAEMESRLRVFTLRARGAEVDLEKLRELKKCSASTGDPLPSEKEPPEYRAFVGKRNFEEAAESVEKDIADFLSKVSAQGITLIRNRPATGAHREEELSADRDLKGKEKELHAEKGKKQTTAGATVTEETREKLQEDLTKAESHLRVCKWKARAAEVELEKYREMKKRLELTGSSVPNEKQCEVVYPLLVQRTKEEVDKAAKEAAKIFPKALAQGIQLTFNRPAAEADNEEEVKAYEKLKEKEKELEATKKQNQELEEMLRFISSAQKTLQATCTKAQSELRIAKLRQETAELELRNFEEVKGGQPEGKSEAEHQRLRDVVKLALQQAEEKEAAFHEAVQSAVSTGMDPDLNCPVDGAQKEAEEAAERELHLLKQGGTLKGSGVP
uniref:DAC domain-containing protein n=1 Tax=Chromera velia CCMP2878 TaxID=1169474 RepID=A0A0G4F0C9_9ALVE|eukprot:Cvel_14456.t1-p1 / transcript=Cvel_14456.t1 / gene=Cvel_14456 / organism=Chromera_velia_CCMP2878 / gene_product=hypothetical protein / transcript_product=hypothetical protein / location=Cvel_scaffold1029:28079-30446(+) / protein_length=677 / sequence_SO=supercontig / SO=protein_coding / is_pseudo=false